MAIRADDVDLGRDRDLVARYQNGDPAAFDDLYRRYFARLHRYCQRHTADTHEAEEVAQEAFVRALGSMDRLQGERRFYPWMTVIARRISIDRHRKLARVEVSDEIELEPVDGGLDALFSSVDATNVRLAMERLGPRHRDVLLLREAEGLSYADIAAHLDVPMTTVEALLHRARKALRREYLAITGDARPFLGLPLLAGLGSRLARLRARVSDNWVELGMAAAPVAAGTVAAVALLGPITTPPATTTATSAGPGSSVVESIGSLPEPSTPVSMSGPTAPAAGVAAPIRPDVAAGGVSVFFGPEGTDHAADRAADMPVGDKAGPTAAGADPVSLASDTAAFVTESVGFLGVFSDQPGDQR